MGHHFNANIPKRDLHWVVDFANVISYPGTGSVIYDLALQNNLAITGSPTFSSTGSSSNLAFSGTGQYNGNVSVVNGALIQGPITVNVIFNPSSISSQNIIALTQGGANALQIGTFGAGVGNIWKFGGTVLLTYTYAGIGSVMHLTYTCDGSNNSKVYVNGVLDNSGTVATQTGTCDNYSLATYNSSGSQLFNGKIYYASIHKTVLSANEVASMYHALKRRWGFVGVGTGVYNIDGVGVPQ